MFTHIALNPPKYSSEEKEHNRHQEKEEKGVTVIKDEEVAASAENDEWMDALRLTFEQMLSNECATTPPYGYRVRVGSWAVQIFSLR